MNILNTKKLSKEQIETFGLLQKDRDENAKVLEKTSMRGVKRTVTEKYSEHAHFIYELLQNADDTRATNVRFFLDKNRLFFAHDGKIHFSISEPHTEDADKKADKLGHINSITSIAHSAKSESQIGMFGVGFKAVFEYTNTPHVYDPPFIFKIERFVIPVLLENDHPNRMDGETFFYFPFDLENKKDTAYKEINEKLKNLDNPLLFLRHLSKIEWKNAEEELGFYSKKTKDKITSLLTKVNGNEFEHKFLIFEKKVKDQTLFEHTINIAYKYDSEGEKISSEHKFPAYCFFRVGDNKELKFIIHAPFLLNDNREGIKDDKWNDYLIKELSELVGDSLPEIRKTGLLDVDFLNVLPIIKDDFKDSKFQPIYEAVLKKLRSDEKLLPANDGSYISAKQALLARGKDLIDLLNPKQLSLLFGKQDCQWLNSDITQDKTPELRKYFVGELEIKEIEPPEFAKYFTEGFIKEQDDEWVIRFYTFLKDQKALWRKKDYHSEGPLRSKQFIRLEKNNHVAPFDSSGRHQAYLPGISNTGFRTEKTVKKVLADDKEAREFLEELGLPKPDLYAEVIESVLPKYQKDEIDVSNDENLDDVEKTIKALKSAPPEKREELVKELKKSCLLQAREPVSNKEYWCLPDIIYLAEPFTGSEILEKYFEGNPNIYFLDERYSDFKKEDFLELGCLDNFKVTCRKPNYYGHIDIQDYRGNHKRGLNGFDPDCEIEGLEYALEHITVEKAQIIWNILKQHHQGVFGTIESSCYQNYGDSKKEEQASKMGKLVREKKWLPDKYCNFFKPSEFLKPSKMVLSDLPDNFDKESTEAKILAEKLDFKSDKFQEYLRQLSGDDREKCELIKELINIPKERLKEFIAKQGEKEQFPVQPVNDEDRRKSKAVENYKDSPKKEYGKRERLVRISQEQTDKRIFLREWYQNDEGKVICQICKAPSSFKNRQDEYYFEAVEIVVDEKEYDANALALCPICAAKYLNGGRTEDEMIKERLRELYFKRKEKQKLAVEIDLCGEKKQVQFVEKHLVDLVPIFEKNSISN